MTRALTIKNVMEKKHDLFEMEGVWSVFESPERNGIWLIWGPEKNGKTFLGLLLSDYLSGFEKALYISAEEGMSDDFKKSIIRARLNANNNNLGFLGYVTLNELEAILSRRKAPKVVVIDNITVYAEELKGGRLRELEQRYKNVLFIYMAHEERGEPYTATAKLAKRLAKRIVHVEGMACKVYGRCAGGQLMIDENRATLYHGQQVMKTA